MANTSLHAAKDAKFDEFYTRIEDINEEMNHYEDKFRGKTIFCNCDDPTWSNFWRYFHLNFEYLGLKKLIATHYEPGEVQTYKMEYTGGDDENFETGIKTNLEQNGDFRSSECIDLLKSADIIVTNPPFSLFREYMATLMKYKKQFLIIGNMNASHYKEIFPLLKNNQVWFGLSAPKEFLQKDGTIKKFGNIHWYTNLDHYKRHEILETTYFYSKKDDLYPDLYPKYENFDGINVDKVNQIPLDFNGFMGVPDGFLDIYNPEQFELIGLSSGDMAKLAGVTKNYRGRTDLAYKDEKGIDKCPYSRIIIRKKAGAKIG